MTIREELIAFAHNIDRLSAGYESWGQVDIQRIAVRHSSGIYITARGAQLTALRDTDVQALGLMEEEKLIAAIFKMRKGVDCIFITHQRYGSEIREEIPPILDDQAQLLGVSVRVAEVGDSAKALTRVLKALQSRYAAVCSDGRCLCIGATLDDTFIAAQLLEKTAKAYTEAKYLGGAKPINRLEAWFMQQYYQLKYAKEAKKNR
jgi:ribulose-5-phosphate 4-epimerase/fuculose-1-phosphate aldolase